MGQHGLEDTAIAKMEVPVVGVHDDQLLLLQRRGSHGSRPQIWTWRSAEEWKMMRQGGDLHWLGYLRFNTIYNR